MSKYKDLGIINTKEMLAKACKDGYAVPAFNFTHLEQAQAIIQAVVETHSPVILQILKGDREYINKKLLIQMVKGLVAYAEDLGCRNPQIALHLDHGDSLDICKACIDDGFSSVMIDGSHLPFEDNIKLTRSVVEYAHKYEVTVEGELGVIAGVEHEVYSETSIYTQPKDVMEFVTQTNCDSLAISIGTAHGTHKFRPEQCTRNKDGRLIPPPLAFNILQEIEQILPGFPIVLHGSSTIPQQEVDTINQYGGQLTDAIGIPESQLSLAVKQAVCKVNIDSDSRLAMTAAIRRFLAENPAQYDPRKYLSEARENAKKIYKHLIKEVLGSANRL